MTAGLVSVAVFFMTAATAAVMAVSSIGFSFFYTGGVSPSVVPGRFTFVLSFLSNDVGGAFSNFLLTGGDPLPVSSTRPVDRNLELKVLTVLGRGVNLSKKSVAAEAAAVAAVAAVTASPAFSSGFLRGILANFTAGVIALMVAKVCRFFCVCWAFSCSLL